MSNRTAVKVMASVVGALAVTAVGVAIYAAPALASVASPAVHDDLAAEYGLSVVWVDGNVPCNSGEHSGCYRPSTPDVIYIQSGHDAAIERSMKLHEIAHAVQLRAGQPLDECAADAWATEHGATWTGYDC